MVFTIDEESELSLDNLDQQLLQDQFTACDPQQLSSMGWVSPLGVDPDVLTHSGANFHLLRARKEERLLPASVIRDALLEKVSGIEASEERKVNRKERMEIKDNLIFEMTPKAFRRSSYTQGLILPDSGLIVVDAGSWKKAEEWLSLLRQSLGSLPVKPVECANSVSGVLTNWLSGKSGVPDHIQFGDECELTDIQDQGAVIKSRRQDLESDEIKAHLNAGKLVTRIALDWNQSFSFILNESLEVKRLRFGDVFANQIQEEGVDAAAEQDAIAHLQAMEFERFLPALWKQFGGLV